jgi:AcrR family transcriptional regulator
MRQVARRKGFSLARQDLVKAAIQVIEAEGASALGINRVARELGVQPSALYNHVCDGDHLRRSVAIEGHRRLLNLMVAHAENDPGERLRYGAQLFRQFAQKNKSLYTIMSTTVLDLEDPEFAPLVPQLLAAYSKILQPFGVPQEHLIHSVRSLQAAFFGFVELERLGMFRQPQIIDESYEWLIELMKRAFTNIQRES